MPSREESAILTDHGERYRTRDTSIARQVEQAVLGTALGANGYTTLAQAEWLAGRLALPAGARVLDIGCGCGWPGLHLAEHDGTRLVGSDLPFEGLVRGVGNAARAGLGESCHWVQASARALPFRHTAFDAVIHADVLCWISAKLSVLRACLDLLRPGGRLAFLTIHPAPGLDEAAYRRACRLGPRAVATRRRDHLEMLATAGFDSIETVDLTTEFRRVAADLLALEAEHEPAFRAAVGDELFDDRRESVGDTLRGIDEGLLRRSLFLARRPRASSRP